MTSSIALLSIGTLGTILFTFYAWSTSLDDRLRRMRQRARELSRHSLDEAAAPNGGDSRGQASTGLRRQLLPTSADERSKCELRLKQAGLQHPDAMTRFFAARLIGLVVPFVVAIACGFGGVVALKKAIPLSMLAGGIGWLLPSFWLDRRIARRQGEFRRALPDFMDLMIVCLQSGLSVPAALQRVTEEISLAHPSLARELETVQRDVALGTPIDAALFRFSTRSGLEAVRTLATFIREARRIGAEIIEALRSHAESMRFQREQRAEENAQRASVKILFPMLLLILPAVFVVLAGPAVIQIQKAFAK
jgi:tight adherence protein C